MIKKLKIRINRITHILAVDRVDPNIFISERDPNIKYHLNDLIGNNSVSVYSLARPSDNKIFTIRDYTNKGVISSFNSVLGVWYSEISEVGNVALSLLEAPSEIDGSSIEEIETSIVQTYTRPIRLERLLKRRTEALKEFLIKFFTGDPDNDIEPWNATRNTVYVDDGSIQTEMGKRRSLGDIYMICKYYYPNCTLKEVIKLLYITLLDELDEGMRTSYCNIINKRVWYYDAEKGGGIYDEDDQDEYGNVFDVYLEEV